jgi:hypothetical protein
MGPPSAFKRQVPRSHVRARSLTRALVVLLLTVSTGWVSAYFWTHTSLGQTATISEVGRRFDHALVGLDAIGWGPSPLVWWARGLEIGARGEQPMLSAALVSVEFELSSAWSAALRAERTVVDGFEIRLAWDASGRLNLTRLWKPKEPAAVRRRAWAFEDVDLSDGVVSLDWPTWGLRFEGVACAGQLRRGGPEGLVIVADLKGSEASLEVGGRVQRFDAHAIEGFEWRERRLRSDRVALSSVAGADVLVSGEMGFAAGVAVDLKGHASLPLGRQEALLSRWLPQGGAIEALTVTRTPSGPWRFDVRAAVTPQLTLAGWEVSELAASFEAKLGRGGLVPSVGFHTRGATARSITRAPDMRLDQVVVGAADLDLGISTECKVSEVTVSELDLHGERTQSLVFEGGVVANMGGGALSASLTTAAGVVTVTGPIETSILGHRLDARLSWRFDHARDGLAAWLRASLPEEVERRAPEILDGRATSRLGVPSSGPVSWSWTSVNWEGEAP